MSVDPLQTRDHFCEQYFLLALLPVVPHFVNLDLWGSIGAFFKRSLPSVEEAVSYVRMSYNLPFSNLKLEACVHFAFLAIAASLAAFTAHKKA